MKVKRRKRVPFFIEAAEIFSYTAKGVAGLHKKVKPFAAEAKGFTRKIFAAVTYCLAAL